MSSNVPSPRFRKSRLGSPAGWQIYKIVQAVAIRVTDRHAVVSVDIDAAGSVENGSPVVRAWHQLSSIGRISTERVGSDVLKRRNQCATAFFLANPPVLQAHFAGSQTLPGHLPISNALLAMKAVCPSPRIRNARSSPAEEIAPWPAPPECLQFEIPPPGVLRNCQNRNAIRSGKRQRSATFPSNIASSRL